MPRNRIRADTTSMTRRTAPARAEATRVWQLPRRTLLGLLLVSGRPPIRHGVRGWRRRHGYATTGSGGERSQIGRRCVLSVSHSDAYRLGSEGTTGASIADPHGRHEAHVRERYIVVGKRKLGLCVWSDGRNC